MKTEKGFTLIELLVAIAIFIIVITATADLFVSMVKHQRAILAEQQLLNETSYATEYMSRAIRMAEIDEAGLCLGEVNEGKNYALTHYNGTDYNGIKFVNSNYSTSSTGYIGLCQEFYWDSEDKRLKEVRGDGDPVPLTSASLQINSFRAKLYGDELEDGKQPRVTMAMDVRFAGPGDQPEKKMQITVSQRNLDENQ